MAGLGETCAHVAAVLFFLEAAARTEDRQTCTDQLCQWKPPSFQKNMEYALIKDIDFTSAKSKKELHESQETSLATKSHTVEAHHFARVKRPTTDGKKSFFAAISKTPGKVAILSLVHPFAEAYVPQQRRDQMPPPLSRLFT